MKVSDVDAKVVAAAKEVERLKEEAKQAEAKKKSLDAQATSAAESGELEHYRALKRQAAEIEEEAFVRSCQLAKLSAPVTEDEVYSAWQSYAASHIKALTARLADLEKKKTAFLDEYESLVKMQNEALNVRARLAGYLKIDLEKGGHNFGLEYIPFQPQMGRPPVSDPVAAFYLSQRRAERTPGTLFPDAVTSKVVSVVANHRPFK